MRVSHVKSDQLGLQRNCRHHRHQEKNLISVMRRRRKRKSQVRMPMMNANKLKSKLKMMPRKKRRSKRMSRWINVLRDQRNEVDCGAIGQSVVAGKSRQLLPQNQRIRIQVSRLILGSRRQRRRK